MKKIHECQYLGYVIKCGDERACYGNPYIGFGQTNEPELSKADVHFDLETIYRRFPPDVLQHDCLHVVPVVVNSQLIPIKEIL